MEAGVLIDKEGNALYWHVPANRSAGYLPDSSTLWDFIWRNRNNISGYAHSHPGSGVPGPSYEDVTTFSAIERALGKKLEWWIITEDDVEQFKWVGPEELRYQPSGENWDTRGLHWLQQLREYSYKESACPSKT